MRLIKRVKLYFYFYVQRWLCLCILPRKWLFGCVGKAWHSIWVHAWRKSGKETGDASAPTSKIRKPSQYASQDRKEEKKLKQRKKRAKKIREGRYIWHVLLAYNIGCYALCSHYRPVHSTFWPLTVCGRRRDIALLMGKGSRPSLRVMKHRWARRVLLVACRRCTKCSHLL